MTRRSIAVSSLWILMFLAAAEGTARADRVDDLLGKLPSQSPVERREAALELGKLKSPRAVSPLIAALKDPEPMVRLDASGALIEIGGPAVDPLIRSVRKETDSIFLWNAIRVLEEIGDPRAVSPLRDILEKQTDPAVQQITKYALDKLQRSKD